MSQFDTLWLKVGVLFIRLTQVSLFMPKEAKDGSPLKHITIKNRTHTALNRIGFRGETFDDIIWRLIEGEKEGEDNNAKESEVEISPQDH